MLSIPPWARDNTQLKSNYLLLSIAVFLRGINDLFISLSLVQDHFFREYCIEAGPVHGVMTLGDFGNVLMFLERALPVRPWPGSCFISLPPELRLFYRVT